MNTRSEIVQEHKDKAEAGKFSQHQVDSEYTFQFADGRPETIAQQELQETINNSPRTVQLISIQQLANNSPRIKQLRAIQEVAYNGRWGKQVLQLQAMTSKHAMQILQRAGLGEEKQEERKTVTQKKENNTGLPDNLKSGIEHLSGYTMDDVNVHYNSDKPAQFNAHAYAQGTDIHLASGQEKHLGHEAWHVVQQKQGRVKPTMQMKGKPPVNDDQTLEKEASLMGNLAEQTGTKHENTQTIIPGNTRNAPLKKGAFTQLAPVQRMKTFGSFCSEKEWKEEQVTNENIKTYLSEVFKPVKNKANKIKQEPFYSTNEKYDKEIKAANTVGMIYQELFDLTEGMAKKHNVSKVEEILKKCEAEALLIEEFKIDDNEIKEGYEKARFSGSFEEFVEWLKETVKSKPYSEQGSANKVMIELENNYPLLFKWVKEDIMATRDHKFWIKEDHHEDRVTSAGAVGKLVKESDLKSTVGPEKVAVELGGQKVAVVKGLELDEVDDMEIGDKFSGIPIETIAEMAFIIVKTGVGDAAPLNVRKLKDTEKYAFIDTGGNYAHSKDPKHKTENPKLKIEENYKAFLENLGEEYDGKFKKWSELDDPKEPKDLLK